MSPHVRATSAPWAGPPDRLSQGSPRSLPDVCPAPAVRFHQLSHHGSWLASLGLHHKTAPPALGRTLQAQGQPEWPPGDMLGLRGGSTDTSCINRVRGCEGPVLASLITLNRRREKTVTHKGVALAPTPCGRAGELCRPARTESPNGPTQRPLVCVRQGQAFHVRDQGFKHKLFHQSLLLSATENMSVISELENSHDTGTQRCYQREHT